MATAAKSLFRMGTRPARRGAPRVDDRLSAPERGYDHRWRKLRDAYIREHPLCQHCLLKEIITPGWEVDHIEPFQGLDDPRRLDWFNLQTLCRPCHATKTAGDQR